MADPNDLDSFMAARRQQAATPGADLDSFMASRQQQQQPYSDGIDENAMLRQVAKKSIVGAYNNSLDAVQQSMDTGEPVSNFTTSASRRFTDMLARQGVTSKQMALNPSPVETINNGIGRSLNGVDHGSSDDVAGGLHDAIGGATDAIVRGPGVIWAATNPLGAAIDLGIGMGTQKVVTAGAHALGANEGESNLAGDLAGLAAGYATDKSPLKDYAGAGTSWIYNKVRDWMTDDPVISFIQGSKPRASKYQFRQEVERGLPLVAQQVDNLPKVNGKAPDLGDIFSWTGKPGDPGLGQEAQPGLVDLAKQDNRQQLREYQGPHYQMGSLVDLSGVGDAIRGEIDSRMRRENPEMVDELLKRAAPFDDTHIPLEEAEQNLISLNKELAGFYDKGSPRQRSITLENSPDIFWKKAQRDALARTIYDKLNDSTADPKVQELQRRYGALMSMQDALYRRLNVAGRQSPNSLVEQAAAFTSAGHILNAGTHLLTGDPLGAGFQLSHAVLQKAIAGGLRDLNSTSGLLRKSLKNYDLSKSPLQDVSKIPTNVAGLLDAGPIRTPLPQDAPNPTSDYADLYNQETGKFERHFYDGRDPIIPRPKPGPQAPQPIVMNAPASSAQRFSAYGRPLSMAERVQNYMRTGAPTSTGGTEVRPQSAPQNPPAFPGAYGNSSPNGWTDYYMSNTRPGDKTFTNTDVLRFANSRKMHPTDAFNQFIKDGYKLRLEDGELPQPTQDTRLIDLARQDGYYSMTPDQRGVWRHNKAVPDSEARENNLPAKPWYGGRAELDVRNWLKGRGQNPDDFKYSSKDLDNYSKSYSLDPRDAERQFIRAGYEPLYKPSKRPNTPPK